MVLKGHTNNTAGSVTLRTADPRDAPAVNFSYFDEGNDGRRQDVRAVVEGVKLVRKMAGGLKGRGLAKEELPGEAVSSDEAIAEWVQDNAWGHHASCSCPIGDLQNGGVVSGDFKVHGTQGLRIVDASVFPRDPRTLHRQRGLHDRRESRRGDRKGRPKVTRRPWALVHGSAVRPRS